MTITVMLLSPSVYHPLLLALFYISSLQLTIAQSPTTINLQDRIRAAEAIARSHPDCIPLAPFYIEIGNSDTALFSISTNSTSNPSLPPIRSTTALKIASASKWVFGALVAQIRSGALSPSDIQSLTMRTGYTNYAYGACAILKFRNPTVNECWNAVNRNGTNSDFEQKDAGVYYYGGGHYQQFLVNELKMGNATSRDLNAYLASNLGQDLSGITFDTPQPAGGLQTTPAIYGLFLRKLLTNSLLLGALLGSNPTCTNPLRCLANSSSNLARFTPIPLTESWGYSLGHWIESDPNLGDGSFSSPGAFGFYPWIDSKKDWYGILAREVEGGVGDGVAIESVRCGRAVRAGWMSGVSGIATGTSTTSTLTTTGTDGGKKSKGEKVVGRVIFWLLAKTLLVVMLLL
ncbi:hypothetical protein HDV05_002955 [Chytridiales sp. JEL 0842]|nr:hypothetical protein HDV05_002955 [Chytridiales sp. JEL 0842]